MLAARRFLSDMQEEIRMNSAMLVEMIGYLGSLLVVVAMLMPSLFKLRVINSIGATIFAIYALIIHSYPTALMNVCLVVINVYNLMKMTKKEQHFELVDISIKDGLITYYLDYYKKEIVELFPAFSKEEVDAAYLVCCDAVPAGFLLGKQKEKGVLEVFIDYSTPAYRDYSVGKYLYSKLPKEGIHTLICNGVESEKHREYLEKMGFEKEDGAYVKNMK